MTDLQNAINLELSNPKSWDIQPTRPGLYDASDLHKL